MIIYLLWHHAEDGPVELRATTDRSKLIKIVESYNNEGWFKRIDSDPVINIKEIIKSTDEELLKNPDRNGDCIINLMNGWGGLHFQIVQAEGV